MAGDLSGRLPVAGSGDEFDRLGNSLNAMLERIEVDVEIHLRHTLGQIVERDFFHALQRHIPTFQVLCVDVDDLIRLIHEADPDISEECKWKKPTNPAGVPVWSRDGIICTGETYRAFVKLTFAHGAKLADPKGLFNASLEGNMRRAIDIRDGDHLDESAFKALVRAAVAHNRAAKAAKPAKRG